MEDMLISSILAVAMLLIGLQIAQRFIPPFVKRHFLNPIVEYLWRRPIRSRGRLFTMWLLYSVCVVAATVHHIASQPLDVGTALVILLLITPIFIGKLLLDQRQRR